MPTPRIRTGCSARVLRHERLRDLELAEMTDAELREWAARLSSQDPEGGYQWATALAAWIRDNVRPAATEGSPAGPGLYNLWEYRPGAGWSVAAHGPERDVRRLAGDALMRDPEASLVALPDGRRPHGWIAGAGAGTSSGRS